MRVLEEPNEVGKTGRFARGGPSGPRVEDTTMDKITRERNPEDFVQSPIPALRFDWTDWLPYLEDQDIPEGQKRELIETLWSIVVAFVDLGWQINPKAEFAGEPLDLKAILTAVENSKEEAE